MEKEFSASIKDKQEEIRRSYKTKAEVIQNDCFVSLITQEKKNDKLNHQAVGQ